MSSPLTIKTFKGTNWEECDDFIRAIRAAAWKEGKFQDPGWIAGFASLHFSHRALSWHSRLPQDVREDWAKLQVALLDQWPPPEDDDEPRIEPTPAAAPSLNRSNRADRPLQGVLKLVIDGSNTNTYFKRGTSGWGEVTDEAKKASRFRCSSLSNATILEQIDGSRHCWLAIQWVYSNPNLEKGSNTCARLVFLDSFTLKTSWGADSPYQIASCILSTDGEVTPVWENKDSSRITLGIFRDNDDQTLCIAVDPVTYLKSYPRDKRVRIFIEPVD